MNEIEDEIQEQLLMEEQRKFYASEEAKKPAARAVRKAPKKQSIFAQKMSQKKSAFEQAKGPVFTGEIKEKQWNENTIPVFNEKDRTPKSFVIDVPELKVDRKKEEARVKALEERLTQTSISSSAIHFDYHGNISNSEEIGTVSLFDLTQLARSVVTNQRLAALNLIKVVLVRLGKGVYAGKTELIVSEMFKASLHLALLLAASAKRSSSFRDLGLEGLSALVNVLTEEEWKSSLSLVLNPLDLQRPKKHRLFLEQVFTNDKVSDRFQMFDELVDSNVVELLSEHLENESALSALMILSRCWEVQTDRFYGLCNHICSCLQPGTLKQLMLVRNLVARDRKLASVMVDYCLVELVSAQILTKDHDIQAISYDILSYVASYEIIDGSNWLLNNYTCWFLLVEFAAKLSELHEREKEVFIRFCRLLQLTFEHPVVPNLKSTLAEFADLTERSIKNGLKDVELEAVCLVTLALLERNIDSSRLEQLMETISLEFLDFVLGFVKKPSQKISELVWRKLRINMPPSSSAPLINLQPALLALLYSSEHRLKVSELLLNIWPFEQEVASEAISVFLNGLDGQEEQRIHTLAAVGKLFCCRKRSNWLLPSDNATLDFDCWPYLLLQHSAEAPDLALKLISLCETKELDCVKSVQPFLRWIQLMKLYVETGHTCEDMNCILKKLAADANLFELSTSAMENGMLYSFFSSYVEYYFASSFADPIATSMLLPFLARGVFANDYQVLFWSGLEFSIKPSLMPSDFANKSAFQSNHATTEAAKNVFDKVTSRGFVERSSELYGLLL